MQCESEWFQILVCCSSHCYDGQAIVDGLYTPYLDVCVLNIHRISTQCESECF